MKPDPSDEMTLSARIARRRHLLRRARGMALSDAGFLHREAAEIIGERLAVTQREFSDPLLLFDGPFAAMIAATLRRQGAPLKRPFRLLPWPEPGGETRAEILDLEPESIDLAVSVFDLQRVADLPMMLMQLNLALKPDGLLMLCLPSAGSLETLRAALLKTEAELTGGAAARIESFAGPREIGDLLHRAGFKLVVTDGEERRLRYGSLKNLLRDLRAAAAGSLHSRMHPPLPRDTLPRLAEVLRQDHGDGDGRFAIGCNLVFASGWKAAPGQQQPLRPGSARHRLGDFL
ncbi:MAG: methyltransferase domain-containing protein [Nitratireductor sp.]|nr:methyltransferase domain-containing protein [Nitratireductor sp.]